MRRAQNQPLTSMLPALGTPMEEKGPTGHDVTTVIPLETFSRYDSSFFLRKKEMTPSGR